MNRSALIQHGFVGLVVILLLLTATRALAAKGVVAYRVSGCDYFVVASAGDYDVLEWYGGHDPDRGDLLVGAYDSYGMKEIYDDTADENVTVWVEDYGLSKEDALEKLADQCN